jgi:OOP family OmpA-OmpF porin
MSKTKQNQVTSFTARQAMQASAAIVLSLGFLGHAAQADDRTVSAPTPGFYVGAGVGANLEEDNRFRGGGATATDSYDTGYAGIGSFGYAFGNGLRVELEPGYRNNSVDKINGATGSGRTQMATLMGNVLYDFNYVTPYFPLHPHVGLGVGYAHVWDRSGPQNGVGVSGGTDVPAFQGIAGLEYALTPNEHVGVDYRYLVAHDASFRVNNGLTTHAGDLDNHTFLVTFRYQFGGSAPRPIQAAAPAVTPPTPAPAAAAPPAPRPIEVYFEFDRATLTPDARAVVDQAAQNAKQGRATRIVATGHTDTVGRNGYNQQLSIRRANAVRAALIADGIAASDIETSGVGKNDLAVPTADNVNEPRNRRVEIIIQAPGM